MALRRGRRLGLPARPQARAGAGRDPRADGLAARSAGAAAPARRAAEAPGAGRRPPSGPADTRPGARNHAEPGLPGRPGEPGRPLTRNRPRHARRSRRFLLGEDQLVVAGVAQPIALVAMADAHFATALQQAQAVDLGLRTTAGRVAPPSRLRSRSRGGPDGTALAFLAVGEPDANDSHLTVNHPATRGPGPPRTPAAARPCRRSGRPVPAHQGSRAAAPAG